MVYSIRAINLSSMNATRKGNAISVSLNHTIRLHTRKTTRRTQLMLTRRNITDRNPEKENRKFSRHYWNWAACNKIWHKMKNIPFNSFSIESILCEFLIKMWFVLIESRRRTAFSFNKTPDFFLSFYCFDKNYFITTL